MVIRSLPLLLLALFSVDAGSNPKREKSFADCIPTSTDLTSFHCASSSRTTCLDSNDSCEEWATRGECTANPKYMLVNCPVSCQACVDDTSVTQIAANPDLRATVHARLRETRTYVEAKVKQDVKHLLTCVNRHALCTEWAVEGKCETNEGWMAAQCAPACRTC